MAAAKKLCKFDHLNITVFDRSNYHLFQPLLYQVAMAGLNPSDIAVPIRRIFRKYSNVFVVLADVHKIDLANGSIFYDQSSRQFDYVIVACGARHSYFGNKDWESYAPGLKTIEQATEIRRRILTAFEKAEKEQDQDVRQSYLTFVVIGGGPTGVELAGAIAEMARCTLVKDFKIADLKKTQVILIESGPRILSSFPEILSEQAELDLRQLGVRVLKKTIAQELSHNGVYANEVWISCRTMIWAAGVQPTGLVEAMDVLKDERGRIVVNRDLTIGKFNHVFAIGDIASLKSEKGSQLPGTAPVAIQQGRFVASQILNDRKLQSREKFRYFDKGMMATIGLSRAVLSINGFYLSGFLAWFAWAIVHIFSLMNFQNRIFVFIRWTFSYLNFGLGSRLIVQKSWRFYSDPTVKEPENELM